LFHRVMVLFFSVSFLLLFFCSFVSWDVFSLRFLPDSSPFVAKHHVFCCRVFSGDRKAGSRGRKRRIKENWSRVVTCCLLACLLAGGSACLSDDSSSEASDRNPGLESRISWNFWVFLFCRLVQLHKMDKPLWKASLECWVYAFCVGRIRFVFGCLRFVWGFVSVSFLVVVVI
jgi:hypothetical protein